MSGAEGLAPLPVVEVSVVTSEKVLVNQKQLTHLIKLQHRCDCGKVYDSDRGLKLHKNRYCSLTSSTAAKVQQPKSAVNDTFTCPSCNEVCSSSSSLGLHLLSHMREKEKCCFLEYDYIRKYSLQ